MYSYLIQIQNNVYGSFYDENRQNWSLLFRTQEECAKFAMYIAVARAASGEFKSVIQQEILVGPKGKVFTKIFLSLATRVLVLVTL
jgi:hypothetical protein